MHALKTFGVWLACGVIITGAIMLVPYEYCTDGPGRGFPFAVLSPLHGPSLGAVRLQPDTNNGQGFDFVSLAGDVVVWAGVAAGVSLFVRRFRHDFQKFRQRNAA